MVCRAHNRLLASSRQHALCMLPHSRFAAVTSGVAANRHHNVSQSSHSAALPHGKRHYHTSRLSSTSNPTTITDPDFHHQVITSNVYDNFAQGVGNTTLIRLSAPSRLTGRNIYGKCEWQNPGGSVKDRAASNIIRRAELDGTLVHGEPGIIVEGTAGNTGIGLTLCGNSRGYKTIIVIADTQSSEKKNMLRWIGAELLEVPALPFKNPNNYVHVAERLAKVMQQEYRDGKRPQRVLYADQWGNLANREAHILTTGPEIYHQLKGKVHAFSCATGTGGTLSGTAEYLKSQNKDVVIGLTDPQGAGLVSYFHTGELKASGDSISEGIGQNRVTGNMAHGNFQPDIALEVTDAEALPVMNDLLAHEGLCVGSSSAINVAGAIKVAMQLPEGSNVVTILCDLGTRYSAKIFNPTFLRSRSLPVPEWLDDQREEKRSFRSDLESRLKTAMV